MRLPIFPLTLVLFPGQTVPLHIFEDRYKAMLKRCLEEQSPFGIVLIKDGGRFGRGTPYSIGTTARILTVEEIDEGACPMQAAHRGNCYHIMVRGEHRIRITALDRREAEYLMGDLDLFPDEPAPEPALLMVGQRAAMLFDDYYRGVVALTGGWQRSAQPGERTLMFDMPSLAAGSARGQEQTDGPRTILVPSLPEEPTALANMIAAELNVTPAVKQELLESPSALTRLQREAEILAEETPQIEERLRLQHRRRFAEFGRAN